MASIKNELSERCVLCSALRTTSEILHLSLTAQSVKQIKHVDTLGYLIFQFPPYILKGNVCLLFVTWKNNNKQTCAQYWILSQTYSIHQDFFFISQGGVSPNRSKLASASGSASISSDTSTTGRPGSPGCWRLPSRHTAKPLHWKTGFPDVKNDFPVIKSLWYSS